MGFNFWFKFKYIFIWGLGGYFVFHPLAMIIGSFMSGPDELFIWTVHETVASEVVASFSLRMLPWSLLFAILNGLVGWFHATLKLSEQAIQRSFQAQTVLNKLLNISLDIIPLEGVCLFRGYVYHIVNNRNFIAMPLQTIHSFKYISILLFKNKQ